MPNRTPCAPCVATHPLHSQAKGGGCFGPCRPWCGWSRAPRAPCVLSLPRLVASGLGRAGCLLSLGSPVSRLPVASFVVRAWPRRVVLRLRLALGWGPPWRGRWPVPRALRRCLVGLVAVAGRRAWRVVRPGRRLLPLGLVRFVLLAHESRSSPGFFYFLATTTPVSFSHDNVRRTSAALQSPFQKRPHIPVEKSIDHIPHAKWNRHAQTAAHASRELLSGAVGRRLQTAAIVHPPPPPALAVSGTCTTVPENAPRGAHPGPVSRSHQIKVSGDALTARAGKPHAQNRRAFSGALTHASRECSPKLLLSLRIFPQHIPGRSLRSHPGFLDPPMPHQPLKIVSSPPNSSCRAHFETHPCPIWNVKRTRFGHPSS